MGLRAMVGRALQVVLALIAVTAPPDVGRGPAASCGSVDIAVLRNLPAGPFEANRMDLWLPSERDATLHGALLVVHGGGWDDPLQRQGGVSPVSARLACELRVPVLSVDYRLVREGGTHPGNVRDLRCALRWVGRHAVTLGLGAPRVVAVGESAGGQLALLAAAGQHEELFAPLEACGAASTETALAGVVSVSAPLELPSMLERPLPGRGGEEAARAVRGVVGGSCAQGVELTQCLEASPMQHAAALPPVLLVFSEGDHLVPASQAHTLAEAMTRNGRSVTLLEVPLAARAHCQDRRSLHGFSPCLLDPVSERTVAWLRRQLR